MAKYLVGICAFNEGEKIRRVIQKFNDYSCYDVVIVNDGSTDGSLNNIPPGAPIHVIHHESCKGAGYGIKEIFRLAKEKGYLAVFFVSGNDKDSPYDMNKLRAAIEQGYDFIQGSRYLPGGKFGAMPFYRQIATRFVHPWLFSLVTGQRITDSTNGFRAIRLSFLDDPRLNLNQPWLDRYELEPYLFYKAIQLGYRVKEVPVTKVYPPTKEGYTKMRPFSGWWSILRPIVYLGLGIRK